MSGQGVLGSLCCGVPLDVLQARRNAESQRIMETDTATSLPKEV